MCIAIPSLVKAVNGYEATVESFGVERTVGLLFHPEVEVGEYVQIQLGQVIERLDEQSARESIALFQSVLEEENGLFSLTEGDASS